MTLPAFVIDADTGATLARFGMEHEPGEYRPERWMIARSYRVPAYGPAGHSWATWSGAVAILLAVALVLGHAL